MHSTSPEITHPHDIQKDDMRYHANHLMTPNNESVTWWDSFAKGIIALTTLGASITFSVILSNLPDPAAVRSDASRSFRPSRVASAVRFDREHVRRFLAVAWLMFVLALGLAMFSLARLKKSRSVGRGTWLLELVLEWLVLAAFMFLALAVCAYVPEVGIAAVAFIAFFAVVAFAMWLGTCSS
jgi:hypothetical protein